MWHLLEIDPSSFYINFMYSVLPKKKSSDKFPSCVRCTLYLWEHVWHFFLQITFAYLFCIWWQKFTFLEYCQITFKQCTHRHTDSFVIRRNVSISRQYHLFISWMQQNILSSGLILIYQRISNKRILEFNILFRSVYKYHIYSFRSITILLCLYHIKMENR